MANNDSALERIRRYNDLIVRQAGKAVRPFRTDGYINLLNRYGTQKDTAEHYHFVQDFIVPDETLTALYEENGLFAKIIDAPSEEAVKHGFELVGLKDEKVEEFYTEALDELDWEQSAENAIKWARLFGGAIIVMLINDGRDLDEPVDWKNIESIDDLRVYERVIVQPDFTSMFEYEPEDPFRTRSSRIGRPEYYYVTSKYGSFTVHESRCLDFLNGYLPENVTNSIYQYWGVPEYMRIKRALKDAEVSHGSATKMLDKAVQPIYKMKDLANELASVDGEDNVLKRMEAIDLARGMLNTMVIDAEGEDYDFRTFSFNGVSETIEAACNLLSALTSIPQTILFGRSPAGMNATGHSDFETYYNYVEHIQKRMLRSNLRYLLSIIFQAGKATGEIEKVPKINVKFDPLWSMTELEETQLEQAKAQVQLTKAQTAQIYAGLQALDPTEIRKKLASEDEFDIDTIITEEDLEDDEIEAAYQQQMQQMGGGEGGMPQMGGMPQGGEGGMPQMGAQQQMPQMGGAPGAAPGGAEQGAILQGLTKAPAKDEEEAKEEEEIPGNSSEAAPAATKLPEDMSDQEKEEAEEAQETLEVKGKTDAETDESLSARMFTPENKKVGSVGVICLKDGTVLSAIRKEGSGKNLIGGPGGHIEPGETPYEAAIRETEEEFGIRPKNMLLLGYGPEEADTGLTPAIFLCTEWDGVPSAMDGEMGEPMWVYPSFIESMRPAMFKPFLEGVNILNEAIDTMEHGGADDKRKKEFYAKYGKNLYPQKLPDKKLDNEAIAELRAFILGLDKAEDDNFFQHSADERDIMHSDANIPDDKVIFRTADNGKVYAINSETGETSGLGDDFGIPSGSGKNPNFDPKDPPTMYSHDRTHEKYWRWEIDNGLSNGTLSKKVNVDAQKKHREGTKEYNDALAKGNYKSIITISGDAVKKLINTYSGKGKARALNGIPREDFQHSDKIGYYVNADGTKKIPTNCGTIHYSKLGAHIVPNYPTDDFYEKWKKGEVK